MTVEAQEMCVEPVRKKPYLLKFVPEIWSLKSQETCERADEKVPRMMEYVPDRYKTQGMYEIDV